jgi:hypothetical protein
MTEPYNPNAGFWDYYRTFRSIHQLNILRSLLLAWALCLFERRLRKDAARAEAEANSDRNRH